MDRIQFVTVAERQRFLDFIVPNHLKASARNENELKAQTDDLPTVCVQQRLPNFSLS
jgi:hypothetical protein